jgi:hypothetical protein
LTGKARSEPRSFPLPHILKPGEILETQAAAEGAVLAVTNQRVIVADDSRPVMDVPFTGLRRIQFDIERGRPAALVIVPEHIADEPKMLNVPIAKLRETALALALIGERINAGIWEQETS